MNIGGVKLIDDNGDIEYLARAIQSRQLKHFEVIDAIIPDENAFQILCNAFRGSAIESLGITITESNLLTNMIPLVNVLPQVPSLKMLDLRGRLQLGETELYSILDRTQIQTLKLLFVNMSNQEATQLARKIPYSKLKFLDVRYNPLNLNTVNTLKHAMKYKSGTKFFFSSPGIGR